MSDLRALDTLPPLVQAPLRLLLEGRFDFVLRTAPRAEWVLLEDFELAKHQAWSDEVDEDLTWGDVRQSDMASVRSELMRDAQRQALVSPIGRIAEGCMASLRSRMPAGYLELRSDLIADLTNVALARLAFDAASTPLQEAIFAAFLAGGWPCGWRGAYPEGRLLVHAAGAYGGVAQQPSEAGDR